MALSVVSQSTAEPVSVVEFKLHQRIDHDHEDDLCRGLISAARQHCEAYVNRILTVGTNTVRLSMDSFWDKRYTHCGAIKLPNPPLANTSDLSITYKSSAGSTGTALGSSVFVVDQYSEPARIAPAYGQVWPTAICELNAVQVTYPVGYTTDNPVPGGIKTAVKMLAGHLYEHREAVNEGGLVEIPLGIKALLDPWKWGM